MFGFSSVSAFFYRVFYALAGDLFFLTVSAIVLPVQRFAIHRGVSSSGVRR